MEISKISKGDTIVQLAQALRVRTDYLLGMDEDTELEPAGVVLVGA